MHTIPLVQDRKKLQQPKRGAPRIMTIDVARGLSVLMMMLVHTLWIYGTEATQQETWLGHTIHFIGKGTPVFLLTMGISFVLSRKNTAVASFKRGLLIIGVAYGMNFLKFMVPILVFDAMPSRFIQAYGWVAPLSASQLLVLLGTGDILQLAGLSLLFMGLVQQCIRSHYTLAAMALCLAAASPWLRGMHVGIPLIDYVCDLFWGKDFNVYFPVFPWASFILLGMSLGRWYVVQGFDQQALFRSMGYVGGMLTLIGGILCWHDFSLHFNDFFHLGFGGCLYLMGINLLILCGMYPLVSKAAPTFFMMLCVYCSKRVTVLYVIQWVLICWGMMLFDFMTFSVQEVLLMMPVVIGLTLCISYLLDFLVVSKGTEPVVKAKSTMPLEVVDEG